MAKDEFVLAGALLAGVVLAGMVVSSGSSPAASPRAPARAPARPSSSSPAAPRGEAVKLAAADPRLRLPELLAELRAAGWQPRIAFTWRSLTEQEKLRAEGKSQVSFGFHNTMRDGRPSAMAADLYDARYAWGLDPNTGEEDPERTRLAAGFFAALGRIAKAMGLSWGGDWKRSGVWAQYGMGWDPGHVQLLPNEELARVRAEQGVVV